MVHHYSTIFRFPSFLVIHACRCTHLHPLVGICPSRCIPVLSNRRISFWHNPEGRFQDGAENFERSCNQFSWCSKSWLIHQALHQLLHKSKVKLNHGCHGLKLTSTWFWLKSDFLVSNRPQLTWFAGKSPGFAIPNYFSRGNSQNVHRIFIISCVK